MSDAGWSRLLEGLGGWQGFEIAAIGLESRDRDPEGIENPIETTIETTIEKRIDGPIAALEALDPAVVAALLGDPSSRLVIELRAKPGVPKRCSRCGAVVVEVHDATPRRVREVPLLDHETWLIVPRARLQCPRCGPTVEAVPWLDRDQRMTTRLAEKIARLGER